MNTKLQGNIGIGSAIAHFTSIGWIVSVPLTDSQKYDLIVDDGLKLQRVSVKTSTYRRRKSWYVLLKQAGGSRKAATSTKFDRTKIELLYVWCGDGSRYLIPANAITVTNALTLGSKYAEYRLA